MRQTLGDVWHITTEGRGRGGVCHGAGHERGRRGRGGEHCGVEGRGGWIMNVSEPRLKGASGKWKQTPRGSRAGMKGGGSRRGGGWWLMVRGGAAAKGPGAVRGRAPIRVRPGFFVARAAGCLPWHLCIAGSQRMIGVRRQRVRAEGTIRREESRRAVKSKGGSKFLRCEERRGGGNDGVSFRWGGGWGPQAPLRRGSAAAAARRGTE
jgi:hypothetical protein